MCSIKFHSNRATFFFLNNQFLIQSSTLREYLINAKNLSGIVRWSYLFFFLEMIFFINRCHNGFTGRLVYHKICFVWKTSWPPLENTRSDIEMHINFESSSRQNAVYFFYKPHYLAEDRCPFIKQLFDALSVMWKEETFDMLLPDVETFAAKLCMRLRVRICSQRRRPLSTPNLEDLRLVRE